MQYDRSAAVLAALLLWMAPGAWSAAETPPARHDPHDHAMGSQIRLHEAGSGNGQRPQPTGGTVLGMDVSSWQGNVDWEAAYAAGARFAYVKATESTSYINPYFAQQYNGSYDVGMIRGAYHFALPDVSSGDEQARYFVSHGGGWSSDGRTLPGALDMEYNPYGATCYGLSASDMAAWVSDFVYTYQALTGRYPTIYTSTSWWEQCLGYEASFATASPLWIARYASSVGELPYPWTTYLLWQYDDEGPLPGDQDLFNGGLLQLRLFAYRRPPALE